MAGMRGVLAGSTRAARHAGAPNAIIATPASSAITPRYVAGSSRNTPAQHRDDGLGGRDAGLVIDRQAHRAPDVGARGPQDRTGEAGMTTMTKTNVATQVYRVLIKGDASGDLGSDHES
jgi:hypothetical protein